MDIFHSTGEYTLTLFHIAPSQSIPAYSHQAGTYLIYKPIYGTTQLKNVFSKYHTNIDILTPFPTTNSLSSSSSIVSRIGGPVRQLTNNSTQPCGVLELAIYPPIVKQEKTLNFELLSNGKDINNNTIANVFNLLNQPYIDIENPIITNTNTNTMINTMNSTENINNYSPSSLDAILLSSNHISNLFESHTYQIQQNLLRTTTSNTNNIDSNYLQYNNIDEIDYGPLQTWSPQIRRNNNNKKPAIGHYRELPKLLSLNIGGLNDQLTDITRRIFYSRTLSKKLLKALKLTHVSGLLLYGQPGRLLLLLWL